MIPAATVEKIKETLRIEEVVGDYVNLKRRGSNLIGLCPLHGEKTPSFNVNPARGIFKCFGCGEGGDAISFVQKHDGVDYVEALRTIARKYNIKIEEAAASPEVRAELQRKQSLQLVNDFARDFYRAALADTDEGRQIGLSYLRHRGYTDATIAKFELGFASPGGTALKTAALDAGYREGFLRDLGLVTKDGRRDFLRDRVVFPIHNRSGKVVAFAGRVLRTDTKAPKYLNSPETELYDKSNTLYGLHLAGKAIRREDACIITEGYADVIALHQAGVEHVVATSGTSLTAGHIRLIKRQTQRVTFLYDGDTAGIKAALRGLDLVLAEDMEVRLVLLPEGHDPDSYVSEHGGQAFRDYVAAESKDFIDYRSDLADAEAQDDPLQRARLVQDLLKTVARVPNVILRGEYVRTIGQRFAIDEQSLVTQLSTYLSEVAREQQRQHAVRAPDATSEIAQAVPEPTREESLTPIPQEPGAQHLATEAHRERYVAELIVRFADKPFDEIEGATVGQYVCANIEEVLDAFEDELSGKIARECHARLGAGESVGTDYWTSHEDGEVQEFAAGALTSPYVYSPGWEKKDIYLTTQKMPEENWMPEAKGAITRFKLMKLLGKMDKTTERMRGVQRDGDATQIAKLLRRYARMEEVKKLLSAELGSVVLR